jgi:hypothetical protein
MFLFTIPTIFGTGYLPASYVTAGTYLTIYSVGVLYLYKRFIKKTNIRYPLAFLGEPDAYFPRFNILRPIYVDVREHPEYFQKKEEDACALRIGSEE